MDRREYARSGFAAKVKLIRRESDETFEALGVNLSEGGMLLKSIETSAVGDVLAFDTSRFEGECEVMWVVDLPGNTLFGVRFTSLDSEAWEAVAKILEAVESSS